MTEPTRTGMKAEGDLPGHVATTVTVLGATGFVGRRIVHELLQEGFRVNSVSRGVKPLNLPERVTWCRADIRIPGELAAIPWPTTVVSTLDISVTAEIMESVPESVQRVIAFSSTSAVTKADAKEAADREVSSRLTNGENRLLRTPREVTVLRPTIIYGGPGDKNLERIAWQLRCFPAFPLVGGGLGLRQPVHANDLARAVTQIIEVPKTPDKIYEVAGAEILPFKDLVSRVGKANGRTARFISIPLPAAKLALKSLAPLPRFRGVPVGALERMQTDLVFDISPARRDFGYSPRDFDPPRYA